MQFQPFQPVPRPRRRLIVLIALSCLLALALAAGVIWHFSVSASPAHPGTWTKTHIYSGNGIYKTETITLSNDWRLQWACSTSETPGDAAPLQIAVYHADGSLAAVALSTVCGGNNTTGLVDVHQGGSVYLLVTSTAIWSFSVQELQ